MKRKAWIKSIRVHKSPGFEAGTFPPIQELGEHLNIIWGPNGVGKSTLTRAMRALIWKSGVSKEVEASASLQTDESLWDLSLANGRLRQIRLADDQETSLPGRNDELSESYWFTLHELLQEDAGNAATFLHEVRTRMQGGIDLGSACERAGGIFTFARATAWQARDAKAAIESLKSVVREQEEHQHIQDDIDALQREIDEGPSLSERKGVIERALFLIETKDAIETLERKLASYDPAIGSITTDSFRRAEELKKALKKAEDDFDNYASLDEELTQEFRECSVEGRHLQDREKSLRLKKRLDEFEKATLAQKASFDGFSQAQETLEEWEREHSWLMSDPPKEATLLAYVEKLKQIASECEPLRCSLDAHTRLVESLGECEQIGHTAKELSKLQLRLSDWISLSWKLQGSHEGRPLKAGIRKKILLLVSLIGILASALGIFVHPTLFIAGPLAILGAIAMLLPASGKDASFKMKENEHREKTRELQQMTAELGIEGPDRWDIESCQAFNVLLEEQISATGQVEQMNRQRKLANGLVETSQEKLSRWVNDWRDAALAIGLQDDEARLEGAQFFHFAQRLEAWSTYRIAYVNAKKAMELDKDGSAKALLALQNELETEESDLAALKTMSESLYKRLEKAAALQVELEKNSHQGVSLRAEKELRREALHQFWETSGLPFGAEERLKRLSSQVEEWQDLQRALRHTLTLYDTAAEESPAALDLSNTFTAEDLRQQSEQIEEQQKVLNGKLQSLGGLIKTYDDLKFGSALSKAQLQRAEALQELETFRQEQVMMRMVTVLASELKEESEKKFQPQVLEQASEWLASITSNRYTLSASDEGFFATDTIMGRNYKVEELSSGTRIQLLFSIRMAFITMQEKSSEVSLPIFLDELLANSDDERASAMVDAIAEIARERQVFYVTAQSDEVERLKSVGPSLVNLMSLEDIAREYKLSVAPLKPYVPEKRQIPEPLEDYHEYAVALSVAGPSLWEPVTGLHSWHLFCESQDLYRYLKLGLSHCAQIVQALGPSHPLSFRLELLKTAQNLAKEGRCRILDVPTLERSNLDLNRGANYWSQILGRVATEPMTGNDLLRLVADKEIKNFSESNQEILTDWLLKQGFASEKQPRQPEEIMGSLFVHFEAFEADTDDETVVRRWLAGVVGQAVYHAREKLFFT